MGQESNLKSQATQTEERKTDHINICLEKDINAKNITTGFEDIYLVHRALSEINRDEIDLTTKVLGHKFSAPIMITGITGGMKKALGINAALAEAVEELGLGMGVGSQRAALENKKLARTYSIVRKKAPTAFIVANIGGSQIIKKHGLIHAKETVEMIEADALAIHLNPLQEVVQPEGETNFAGILNRIEEICKDFDLPVIIKETGAGICAEDAIKLERAGVAAIDVSGAGGTSWAAVEYHRAKQRGDEFGQKLGLDLWDWGIPTVISLFEVTHAVNLPVIASGGVRSGTDITKALALGADLTGFALPILQPAIQSGREVKKNLKLTIHQLRTVMFLVASNSIEMLKDIPLLIIGKTAEILRIKGYRLKDYAKRGDKDGFR